MPTFPSARHVFARAEHEHWHDHESAFVDLSDTVEVVTAECRHELVEVDHAFTDEVRFVPSPGHTPGHVSVGIRSHGQEALISGDLLHHPLQLVEPSWSSVADDDRAAAERTRRQVLADVAARDVLFIGTHFAAPSAGHVREVAPSGFAWLPAPAAAGSGS